MRPVGGYWPAHTNWLGIERTRVGTLVTLQKLDVRIARLRQSTLGELAFVTLLTLCCIQFVRCASGAVTAPGPTDFAAFVENARTWRSGKPYVAGRDPNAPHVIAFFALFESAPLPLGMIVWLCLSAVAAALSLRAIRETTGWIPSRQTGLLFGTLFLAMPSTGDMVVDGNLVWALWLPFTLSWSAARRGGHRTSGVLIGALMTAKPFLALWLIYFAVRGNRVSFTWACVGIFAAVAMGMALTGSDAWWAWVEVLGKITWYGGENNASVAGLIARTAGIHTRAWVACALLIGAFTVYRWRQNLQDVDKDWALALIAAVLIGPLGWRYYFCWIIGPLTGWLCRSPQPAWLPLLLLVWAFTPAIAVGNGELRAATIGSSVFWSTLLVWITLWFWTTVPEPDIASDDKVRSVSASLDHAPV